MIEARVQRGNWGRDLEVLLVDRSSKDFAIVTDLILTHQTDGTIVEPSFKMSYEHAQQLMDDLWVCGLRPSEGTGSAGALASTQKHLDDMRKLVFDYIQRSVKDG